MKPSKNLKAYLLIAFVAFCLFPNVVQAFKEKDGISKTIRDRRVTGVVTDSGDGLPLPGVNVTIKGSSTGVSTDANGAFAINIPNDGATLIFSFIGYGRDGVMFLLQHFI